MFATQQKVPALIMMLAIISAWRTTVSAQTQDFFYHADDLHNVTAITNTSGTVVENYEYDDYGRPLNSTSLQPAASSLQPLLFNGRRYDPETGWYYYRTRYMDPRAGRFTSRDTIGIWGDGANLGSGYAYVGSDPSTLLDPYGEAPDCSKATKGVKAIVQSGDIDHKGNAFSIGAKGATLADAIRVISTQVKDKKSSCIEQLVIDTHAGSSGMNMRGRKGKEKWTDDLPRVDEGPPNKATRLTSDSAQPFFHDLNDKVCFCKPCEIWLLGCNIGLGTVPEAVAYASGCTVYAPMAYCFSNIASPEKSGLTTKHEGKIKEDAIAAFREVSRFGSSKPSGGKREYGESKLGPGAGQHSGAGRPSAGNGGHGGVKSFAGGSEYSGRGKSAGAE